LDGVKFRRQEPVGSYIVDFVSFDKKLIMELDGGQHNEDRVIDKDEERTKWLGSQGFRVLRFWNDDIMQNLEGVIIRIKEVIQ
jgi:very-short-patch-repair endonuclease